MQLRHTDEKPFEKHFLLFYKRELAVSVFKMGIENI